MTASIHAIEIHLPENKLDNIELAKGFSKISANSLYKITGIQHRHIAAENETPSDLAFVAAQKLFSKYPEERTKIDLLIFCTEGFDYKAPLTACLLHHKLNLKSSCLSLDIPGGCTGFINSLLIAKSLIASNPSIATALILTAEAVSKVLHPQDLHLRMLFGDGATATLVKRTHHERIGRFIVGTDGTQKKALWVERSGFREPADIQWLNSHQNVPNTMRYGRLIMQGDELLHFSLTKVPALIQNILVEHQLTDSDIDLYVFHQASKIILKALQKKCRIPDSKFYISLESTGNTVSSTIPIALSKAQQQGIIKSGDKIMLIGFGVGLAWGGTIIDWPPEPP